MHYPGEAFWNDPFQGLVAAATAIQLRPTRNPYGLHHLGLRSFLKILRSGWRKPAEIGEISKGLPPGRHEESSPCDARFLCELPWSCCRFKWHAIKAGPNYYACRKDKCRSILMHREIMQPPEGMVELCGEFAWLNFPDEIQGRIICLKGTIRLHACVWSKLMKVRRHRTRR